MADSIKQTGTIKHINDLLAAARAHKIPVYYGLHQQYNSNSFQGWKHMKFSHESQKKNKGFEEGSWGATIFEGMEPDYENGDVIFGKHWSSSSYQNTDLEFLLRQRDITNVVIAGLTANTCVESTARYAYDIGYHVTLLSDATAAFSEAHLKAATELMWPMFASKVVTTDEYVATL
ncbi:hypothetical protein ACHAQJ_004404 [Trichoderma viride]